MLSLNLYLCSMDVLPKYFQDWIWFNNRRKCFNPLRGLPVTKRFPFHWICRRMGSVERRGFHASWGSSGGHIFICASMNSPPHLQRASCNTWCSRCAPSALNPTIVAPLLLILSQTLYTQTRLDKSESSICAVLHLLPAQTMMAGRMEEDQSARSDLRLVVTILVGKRRRWSRAVIIFQSRAPPNRPWCAMGTWPDQYWMQLWVWSR